MTNRNIQIVAEGHDFLRRKFDRALTEAYHNETDRIRLNELGDKVDRLQSDVDDLKTKLA